MFDLAIEKLGRLPSELPWEAPTTEMSWIGAYFKLIEEERMQAEIEAQTKAGPGPDGHPIKKPPK